MHKLGFSEVTKENRLSSQFCMNLLLTVVDKAPYNNFAPP